MDRKPTPEELKAFEDYYFLDFAPPEDEYRRMVYRSGNTYAQELKAFLAGVDYQRAFLAGADYQRHEDIADLYRNHE